MPKVNLNTAPWLGASLICPRCRAQLSDPSSCRSCGAGYPMVDGQPVLINFEQSIFSAEEYADSHVEPVEGGSAVGRAIAAITYGGNKTAPKMIADFLEEIGSGTVLVIGGGSDGAGTEALYAHPDLQVVSTDVYAAKDTALLCDGHSLPFKDGTFDAVFIQAVLEHVLDPGAVVEEIHRVLNHRGVVLAETPFLQGVHMGAYDFTRFTLSGHRWLFRRFDEIEAETSLGPEHSLLWSIAQTARALGFGEKGAALAALPFFWVRYLRSAMKRGPASDGASGYYFMGRRSETVLGPKDMIAYYASKR